MALSSDRKSWLTPVLRTEVERLQAERISGRPKNRPLSMRQREEQEFAEAAIMFLKGAAAILVATAIGVGAAGIKGSKGNPAQGNSVRKVKPETEKETLRISRLTKNMYLT